MKTCCAVRVEWVKNRPLLTCVQAAGGSATSEVAKTKMAMIERGQKLSEVEDRTEAMANEAKVRKNCLGQKFFNSSLLGRLLNTMNSACAVGGFVGRE